jgi:glutathione synthase
MGTNTLKLGIVMDPIESITPYKDSSFAMLLEAERRGAEIHYFRQQDLKLLSGVATGRSTRLRVRDDDNDWYQLCDSDEINLAELDVVLMRKDPPFDMEYVYTTYILDRAREAGCLVVNRPQALRDMNEKAYTAWFPECAPETLITRSMTEMKAIRCRPRG